MVVEGKLSADDLGQGGNMVEVQEQVSDLDLVLGDGFVLEAKVAEGCGFPGETEVILLKVLGVSI